LLCCVLERDSEIAIFRESERERERESESETETETEGRDVIDEIEMREGRQEMR
jgi:hypothetical protein